MGAYKIYFGQPTVSAGNITMPADAGSYTFTGTAATLKWNRVLVAAAGSYTLTGTDANLLQGYKVTADSGTYNLTGTDVSLLEAKRLVADAGTYNLTGTSASLLWNRILPANSGSYTLNGTAAALSHGYSLIADAGSFILNGTAATLSRTRVLMADSGTFNLTGSTVGLQWARIMIAGAGSYVLNGTAVDLRKGVSMIAESGSFSLTGTAIAFSRTYVLQANAGSFILNGTDLNFKYFKLFASPGSFLLTGTDVALIFNPHGGGGTIIRGPELSQGGDYYHLYLNAGASSVDNVYVGAVIVLTGGTGEEQSRLITAYNGTTKKAKVAKIWSTRPDITTEYVLVPKDSGYEVRSEELAQGATFEAIYLNAAASAINNTYVGALLDMTDGPGANQMFRLKGYNGTTKKAAILGRFNDVPTSASSYIIRPNNDERY